MRKLRHTLKNPDLPPTMEENPKVRELRQLAEKMAGPVEEVFHLSKEPQQCTIVSMVMAQYLREEGYDAHTVPAIYTRMHPSVTRNHGFVAALMSRFQARSLSNLPADMRDPKLWVEGFRGSEEMKDRIYRLLYESEDCFVGVRIGDREQGEMYMMHGTYRQFLRPRKQTRIPPIIVDRMDEHNLQKTYHLAITAPRHAAVVRDFEDKVFSPEEPKGVKEGVIAFRALVREKYDAFKASMERQR
jgi:hypothetical protein